MVGNSHCVRFVSSSLIFLVLSNSGAVQADQGTVAYPRIIEVFTTTDVAVTGETTVYRQPENQVLKIQIYQLDGIQSVEAKLSKNLSADPEQSRRMVLQHIQELHEADRAQMQSAAMGLSKAVQYGIDRYPVVVLDGEVALYGVTDLVDALQQYQLWREEGAR